MGCEGGWLLEVSSYVLHLGCLLIGVVYYRSCLHRTIYFALIHLDKVSVSHVEPTVGICRLGKHYFSVLLFNLGETLLSPHLH